LFSCPVVHGITHGKVIEQGSWWPTACLYRLSLPTLGVMDTPFIMLVSQEAGGKLS